MTERGTTSTEVATPPRKDPTTMAKTLKAEEPELSALRPYYGMGAYGYGHIKRRTFPDSGATDVDSGMSIKAAKAEAKHLNEARTLGIVTALAGAPRETQVLALLRIGTASETPALTPTLTMQEEVAVRLVMDDLADHDAGWADEDYRTKRVLYRMSDGAAQDYMDKAALLLTVA